MIKSINHKGLRQLWENGKTSKLPSDQMSKIRQILEIIDSAQTVPQDLNFSEAGKFIRLKENGRVTGVLLLKKTGVSYSGLLAMMPLILTTLIIIKKNYIMTSLKRNMPLIHPGEFLKTELIEANGLTITEVAALLKVSRQALSNIINKKADISPEMAMRIATVFGGTPDIWLRLQAKYDLEKAAKKISQFKLEPYHASA